MRHPVVQETSTTCLDPCKFKLNVDLTHCCPKPLCDNQFCYANHGATTTLEPKACPGAQFRVIERGSPEEHVVQLSEQASLVCDNGILLANGFGGRYQMGLVSIECADVGPTEPEDQELSPATTTLGTSATSATRPTTPAPVTHEPSTAPTPTMIPSTGKPLLVTLI